MAIRQRCSGCIIIPGIREYLGINTQEPRQSSTGHFIPILLSSGHRTHTTTHVHNHARINCSSNPLRRTRRRRTDPAAPALRHLRPRRLWRQQQRRIQERQHLRQQLFRKRPTKSVYGERGHCRRRRFQRTRLRRRPVQIHNRNVDMQSVTDASGQAHKRHSALIAKPFASGDFCFLATILIDI